MLEVKYFSHINMENVFSLLAQMKKGEFYKKEMK